MKRHRWSPEEDELLRQIYPNMKTELVALRFGLRTSQAYSRASQLGLKKSEAFLASPDSGRTDGKRGAKTRFAPGQAPWSKGKKVGTRGRSGETQFAKGVTQGRAAKLLKPIGFERVTKDGYRERKTNNGRPIHKRWRAVHLILWEESHGPIPADHALCFKNGNKADIRLDNLELVTRADLARRNSIHNYPPVLADSMRLVGRIKREVRKQTERHAHEEQG